MGDFIQEWLKNHPSCKTQKKSKFSKKGKTVILVKKTLNFVRS